MNFKTPEVAVVHTDDSRAGSFSAFQLPFVVDLHQRGQAQPLGVFAKVAQVVIGENRHDQQNRVRTLCRRFGNLLPVDREILAEHWDLDSRTRRAKVVERAAEELLVGEYAQCCRSATLIGSCNRRRIEYSRKRPLAGRGLFHFRDDCRRVCRERARKVATHYAFCLLLKAFQWDWMRREFVSLVFDNAGQNVRNGARHVCQGTFILSFSELPSSKLALGSVLSLVTIGPPVAVAVPLAYSELVRKKPKEGTVKKFAYAVVLGAALCSFSFADDSWTGVIAESKCGAKHADADTNEKSAACIKSCVKGGASPVLVTDGKVVSLDKTSQEKVMAHLGHKVTVTGKLEGDTLHIDSVKM